MKEPKVLVYDLETTPVLAWIWRCGEQYIGHDKLYSECNETKIICATYRWLHEKKSHALIFDLDTLDDFNVVATFAQLATEADVIIGKNNTRFDDKHIQFRLFQHNLPPIVDFKRKSDDLESWMRKNFNMQSFALDYIAKLRLGAGKHKMELNDWIQIVQHRSEKHLKKMVSYGLKDVDDTVALIKQMQPYVQPKYNMAAHYNDLCCTNCGSHNLVKDGIRVIGNARKQRFYCNGHHGYAGLAVIRKDGSYGVMGK